MKTFKRHKTFDEVVAQCREQGVYCDIFPYVRQGADTICIGAPARTRGVGWAIYNVTNGCFRGETPHGTLFDSSNPEHGREPWMQALLAFFYES